MKLHLLCAILSHSFSSLVLSLLLLFRHLVWRFRKFKPESGSVSLYQCTIWHERRHPVHNYFKFTARYALIDLDLTTNSPPTHLSANEARQAVGTNGPVLLFTIPPSVGYQRSPVTLYYCYQNQGSTHTLHKCILEVSNTPWCEKVLFSFDPNSDVVAKALHISPFMDMVGNWRIKTKSPGENVFVKMSFEHPQLGNILNASLTAKRVLSSSTLDDHSFFFWLMPHKIAFITYWQALRLWWKNARSNEHPAYNNSAYREDVMLREQKLQCFQDFSRGANCNNPKVEGPKITRNNDSTSLPSVKVGDRWFTWRETKSKWPWNSI